MDPKFVAPFMNATVEVLNTMAATEFEVGDAKTKEDNGVFGIVTGLIGLAGKDRIGNLVISFDEPAILSIVENMIGETHAEVNQEVVDAVGELTNMICGVAKKHLDDMGVSLDMATPTVFLGRELRLRQLAPTSTLTVPCKTARGQFVVEVNLDHSKH